MDITKDCIVRFKRPVFSGRWPKAKFSHMSEITALVLRESYGQAKQQHTFTLQVIEETDSDYRIGDKTLIKGRNLYPHIIEIIPPANYEELRAEKHQRGDKARAAAQERKQENRRDIFGFDPYDPEY